ncbi:hypothetical protein NX722_18950 [Endozoicomonas gorgoniicola]|uniref:Uncharacterized protein n=1 Tax=Endozoicomonas gorgoniicola TaxID=1234144 RepID=A0ABT3MZ63_9GAMM|nr:hypothetical protein [Endozoicomonas gorgoniicola]MCW7554660.1 hypothetical protein [Endozoicomonas gorgoniicola]
MYRSSSGKRANTESGLILVIISSDTDGFSDVNGFASTGENHGPASPRKMKLEMAPRHNRDTLLTRQYEKRDVSMIVK